MKGGLVLLPAASAPAATSAEPLTAEKALEKYRETFRPVAELECPRDPEAITVCGRRDSSDRYRVPYRPQPGEREHLVRGEAPRASTSVGACISRCNTMVGVTLKTRF